MVRDEERVVQEVGRSEAHLVARVRDRRGSTTILKKVLASGPDPAAAAARLRHEHDLLTHLSVSGVVRPLGWEPHPTTPALLLEDAGTANLEQRLRGEPMAVAPFLQLAIGLTELLARLHASHVIHRDLCPANIVVDGQDHLTLVDFESAVLVPSTRLAGVAPEPLAELAYLAPEQTGRMNRLVDRRADLYSLGAIFYRMLSGSPPFPDAEPMDVVHAHLARAPVPLERAVARVPPLLSQLVLRLLAKMPEQRYQSAEGLLADLRGAAARLQATGEIAPFELGLEDLARELPLPARLYGRLGELDRLRAIWERVRAGASEVLVLTGETGVGKSALAEALGEMARREGGRVARGKPDSRRSNIPYAPFVEAFRALVAEVRDGPPETAAAFRHRVRVTLGGNAGVVTTLVPELEALVGPSLPVPLVGSAQTEMRFRLGLLAFVRALAGAEHPLMLFIDDLQWVDSGTLALLRLLRQTGDPGFFLLACACREDEAAPEVGELLAAWRCADRAPTFLPVPPLDGPAMLGLTCDVFGCDRTRGAPLAQLLLKKTGGNPFFVGKLLRHLQQSGLVVYDTESQAWTWDLERISRLTVTENVAMLLADALSRLPAATRERLAIGACIGQRPPLWLIAAVVDEPVARTADALAPALHEGLIAAEGQAVRFEHDRIQHLAYALAGDGRAALHLRIGRLLRVRAEAEHDEDTLFDQVDQLYLGASQISDPQERRQVAGLGLRAGRKACLSSAWGPALAYMEGAMELLAGDTGGSDELAFQLYRDAGDAAWQAGKPARADQLLTAALEQARTRLDRVDLLKMRTEFATVQGDWPTAILWGARALRLLDLELPLDDPGPAAAAELEALERRLRERPAEELLRAPVASAPEVIIAVELLQRLQTPTYISQPQLWRFCVARALALALEHGPSRWTGSDCEAYAVLLQEQTADFVRAHALGRLGVQLAERMGDPIALCRAAAIFEAVIAAWREPITGDFPLLRRVQGPARALGEIMFSNACSVTQAVLLFHAGFDLATVLEYIEAAQPLVDSAPHPLEDETLRCYRHAVAQLQGVADDQPVSDRLNTRVQLGVDYLLGNQAGARTLAGRSRSLHFTRSLQMADFNFYSSLTLIAACAGAPPEERRALLATVADNQQQMALWAASCPENFEGRHLLVQAELAHLAGQGLAAAELYDRAARAAAHGRCLSVEALANELAARAHDAHGRPYLAARYLDVAIQLYRRWGARAKVATLEQELATRTDGAAPRRIGASSSEGVSGSSLDLLALLQAAEALSAEVVLSRLGARLVEICLAAAGAERGALLLVEEGQLLVQAAGSAGAVVGGLRQRLERSSEVAVPVIDEARRTGQPVVLADASAHERFGTDPHVQARGVRSVLALPILHQGTLVGVLYLENNLATRVFLPARLQLLQLLSSHIATSLRNSQLFERLTREVDERRRVEEAVRFVAEAGSVLADTLDFQETVNRLATLAVSGLADWCVVLAIEDGRLRRVAAAHRDPAKEGLLRGLDAGPRGPMASANLMPALAGWTPLLLDPVDDQTLERFVDDADTRRIMRQLGARSAMVLPLTAHGRAAGALTLVRADPDRPFGARDLALAEELARRAAMALESARLYREAQRAIEVRDEFMSIASHELRTPISSMLLMIQGLQEEVKRANPSLWPSSLDLIARQVYRLRALADDMLDVNNIQSGRMPLHLAEVDLVAVVREVLGRFAVELERTCCRVDLHTPAVLLGWWDRVRLEQVVANLLSNAIKFAPGLPVEITLLGSDGRARLMVVDRGQGIPADRLPHIFGRFERGVSASHYGGLGLGLYVVSEIVRALGGTVAVESALGQGARFTVELPLRPPSHPAGGT